MPSPTALIIDGVPTNLVLPEGSRATHVDRDMHDICLRLRELDANLRLCLIEHVDGRAIWSVNELLPNGKEEMVVRVGPGCKLTDLDTRVIAHIEWIRRIPAAERLASIERDIDRERAAAEATASEKLYDSMGSKFYSDLHKLGFIDGGRRENMRPLNKTARRAGRSIHS